MKAFIKLEDFCHVQKSSQFFFSKVLIFFTAVAEIVTLVLEFVLAFVFLSFGPLLSAETSSLHTQHLFAILFSGL